MEVEKLINKRRALVKRMENLYDFAHNAKIDATKVSEFKIKCEKIDNWYEAFDDLHMEIVTYVNKDNLQEQDDVQTKFDDMYSSIRTVLGEIKDSCQQQAQMQQTRLPERVVHQTPAPSIVSQIGQFNSQESLQDGEALESTSSRIKLPRIQIDKFDGSNIKQWPMFYDMFTALIHKNRDLTDVERFQYLVSYLSRDALSVVKNLPLTSENYHIAYQALIARYQNKRVLVTSYWQSIMNANRLTCESASAMRDLLSVFSENLAALELFDCDMWDFTKLCVLLQKVDLATKRLFELEFSDDDIPTFEDLKQFLTRHCKALETTQMTSQMEHPVKKQTSSTRENSVKTKSAFVTTANKSACYVCKQSHPVTKCDEFLKRSPDERNDYVKRNQLCFNCLSDTHALRDCTSEHTCRVCSKRHHTLIHYPSKQVQSDQGSRGQKSVTNMSVGMAHTTTVLFQTAIIRVKDGSGHYQRCRAILDCASEASFITEVCLKRLGLSKKPSAVPIFGINQMSSSNRGMSVCWIKPYGKPNPILEVEVYVVPRICGKVPAVSVSKHKVNWPHIKDIHLADPEFGSPGDIDILLGADIYSNILQPGLRKGAVNEPTAVNTIFGYVVTSDIWFKRNDKNDVYYNGE